MAIINKVIQLSVFLIKKLHTFLLELTQIISNARPEVKQVYQYVKKQPVVYLIIIIVSTIGLYLLFLIPHLQVAHFGITKPKELADAENSFRVTLAQIFGGIGIGIGLYYTWRRIIVSQEGQITDRFTKAVNQLGAIDQSGNPSIEIRLGGIYALERISKESENDYWPIMEILTSYIRKNSRIETIEGEKFENISMDTLAPIASKNQEIRELPFDSSAIITVIARRKYSFGNGENKGLNLSLTNLKGAEFLKANLEGANLSRANLSRANLSRANLSRANLSRANLEETYLKEANLSRTNLSRANLKEADFEETNLEGANLKEANLSRANLSRANLEEAYLYRTNLKEANLYEAELNRADFEGADLEEANLSRANLKEANLRKANLEGAYFEEADLSGAYLYEADLPRANLSRADFEGAYLYGAYLKEANLKEAYLSRAHLSRANFEEANLEGAYFEEAELNRVNLYEADLKKAHLSRADFEEANLEGANLEEANLEGAKNLTIDQLSKAKTLHEAALNEELFIQLKEKYPTLFEKLD